MRLTLIAFLLLCGAAQAGDCVPPRVDVDEIRGLRAFAECLISEVAGLERGQARLQRRVEDLEKALAAVPGALQNESGRITRLGGPRLAQASFAVTARAIEGASTLAIDQHVLEDLCASGCTFSLMLVAKGLRDADPAPVFATGPCGFRYGAENGVWARSDLCGEPAFGIDGDGKPQARSGGEVIAVSGGACMLADSEPSRSVGAGGEMLGEDRAKGLFLIAAPALWTGTEDRFRCELKFGQ